MTTAEHKRVDALEGRIEKEKEEAAICLEKQPKSIAEFYWGEKEPHAHGVAMHTERDGPMNLREQLLLTPHLIVSMLPMQPDKFNQFYGITVTDAHRLSEHNFLRPMIYYYLEGRYKEYAQHPKLADMLAQFGKANTEWAELYLTACCGMGLSAIRRWDDQAGASDW